jgi:hypothetical protein
MRPKEVAGVYPFLGTLLESPVLWHTVVHDLEDCADKGMERYLSIPLSVSHRSIRESSGDRPVPVKLGRLRPGRQFPSRSAR